MRSWNTIIGEQTGTVTCLCLYPHFKKDQSQTLPLLLCSCGQEEPTYSALWGDNKAFNEVIISPAMLNEHMPHMVMEGLHKVCSLFCPLRMLLWVFGEGVNWFCYSAFPALDNFSYGGRRWSHHSEIQLLSLRNFNSCLWGHTTRYIPVLMRSIHSLTNARRLNIWEEAEHM